MACAEFYLSAALVSQVWQGAGNSANDDYIEIIDDDFDEEMPSANKDADLGLWAFRTEAGVRF